MGTYLNPGNSGFARIINSDYIDKTGMIGIINSTIDTTKCLTCISRPRRFGKSYAAQMLSAYYDKSCDSRALFENYAISKDETYEKHLNKYDVIYLDMTQVTGEAGKESFVDFIKSKITEEIQEAYPSVEINRDFSSTLINMVNHNGNKVIAIIDEWDAPIREIPEKQQEYLRFLRTLFKSSNTTSKIFAAVYMTGILPIKKDGSQSAISDFREYSVLMPGRFGCYVGFTEDEVKELCNRRGRDFNKMKEWYDGYTVGKQHSIYNPYSVMQAVDTGVYTSYWKKTSAAEALMTYIDMDQDGLQEDIARLIAGESIIVDTDSFQNDVETFSCKDDVLTLLIHLGYLTYEEVPDSYDDSDGIMAGFVRIPNEEVRTEFDKLLRRAKHKSLIELVKKSDKLLKDTLEGSEEAVAKAIAEVHDSQYATTFYNNEQSLRYVVKMAYISCVDQYAKIEELPTGHGIADVAFIPKRNSNLPAMIVELKWNKSGEEAISQIENRNYQAVFKGYGGDVVLVGVSYDVETKEHCCRIERKSMGH